MFVVSATGVAFSLIVVIVICLPLKDTPVESTRTTASVGRAVSDLELPIRLTIPKIGVDAFIEAVGLTPGGAMDVSADPANTAWLNRGPHPGENGTAVIAGHFGWKNDIPAVFDNLYTLQKGDKLYVKNAKGMTTTFVVRDSRVYDASEEASSVFGSRDSGAHLNLITCDGVWNETKKSYSDRLVVFTDKE